MAEELTTQITFTSKKIIGHHDVVRLETRLSGLEGVRDVTVDPIVHTVAITFDPTELSAPALQIMVDNLGYPIGSVADAESG
jgi:hypothetical protein